MAEVTIAVGEPIPFGVVVTNFELLPGFETSRTLPVYIVQKGKNGPILSRHTDEGITGELHDCEVPLATNDGSPLAMAAECVGAIASVFKSSNKELKTVLGTAFSVAPGILITAKHNLIYMEDPEEFRLVKTVFTPAKNAKHLARNTLLGIEKIAKYFPCEVLTPTKTTMKREEVKTSLSETPQKWMIAYDVAVLSVSEDVFNTYGYMCPFSQCDEPSPLISLIGYPGAPPHKFLDAAFPLEWTYRGLANELSEEQIRHRKSEFLRIIFSYDDKCVCPGTVLDFVTSWNSVLNDRTKMLRIGASSLNGISGGPCVHSLHPKQFAGIIVGSFAGANCNFAVSVFHPAFAVEYSERVLPAFIKRKSVPADVVNYIRYWKHVIRESIFNDAVKYTEQ